MNGGSDRYGCPTKLMHFLIIRCYNVNVQISKYVRAIREGRITFDKPKEKPRFYLLWGDDSSSSEKTRGLSYIPPPKAKLPGMTTSG